MPPIAKAYFWEMEMSGGEITAQYDKAGSERRWKDLDVSKIVRVSLIPSGALPRHDCLIDLEQGESFVKRFGRGFLKSRDGFKLSEYLQCIETNKYRMWVSSITGSVVITKPEYELYI